MNNLTPDENRYSIYARLTGFPRYRELLECEGFHFLIIGLIALIGFIPFAMGVTFAIMTSSILVLIPACIIGGVFAGPFLAALYDAILRCLRNAPYQWWRDFKFALKKNWKDALVPGMLFCLFWGVVIFMGMMIWQSKVMPTGSTILMYFVSMILFMMIFSTFWPQVVLFRQSGAIRLKNSILFCFLYFFRIVLVSILQVSWIVITVLLLPWSILLLPFLNFWFILFLSCFLLYDCMNESFSIEKQIEEQFPDQVPVYDVKDRED